VARSRRGWDPVRSLVSGRYQALSLDPDKRRMVARSAETSTRSRGVGPGDRYQSLLATSRHLAKRACKWSARPSPAEVEKLAQAMTHKA
jgi:hypothetical protein